MILAFAGGVVFAVVVAWALIAAIAYRQPPPWEDE